MGFAVSGTQNVDHLPSGVITVWLQVKGNIYY